MRNTYNPCGCGNKFNITAGGEFPDNPRRGDVHIGDDGIIYQWDGTEWVNKGQILIPTSFFGSASPTDTPEPATGDGYWIVTEEGTYTNFGGISLPANSLGVITRVDGVYDIQVTTIDLSSYAKTVDFVTGPVGVNEFNPLLIQDDTIIASNGNIGTGGVYVGGKSVIGQPVIAGQDYTVSGVTDRASFYIVFRDSGGSTVGSVESYTGIPKTMAAPPNAVTVDYTIKSPSDPDDSWFATLQWEKGTEASPYEPYIGVEAVTYIIDKGEFAAKYLLPDNIAPNPVGPQNVVNKGYFDANAIQESDLTLVPAGNMFDPSAIIDDKYVNNMGGVLSGIDWQMILIPVDGLATGSDVTFGRIFATNPSYWAFYDANPIEGAATILSTASWQTAGSATVQVPSGALFLGITIKRPADPVTVYDEGTINQGTDLLTPYQPFTGEAITAIKGHPLSGSGGSGGEAYDQSLNTTDNVQFASVVTGELTAAVLIANLPEGAGTPPVGLGVNQAWIDTADGNTIKANI